MKTSPIQINEHLSIVGSLLPGMASYLRQILSPGTGGYRVWLSSVAGGSPSYALTFGMETREDIVQFRRRKSVSGTIGRSAVTRPPPRKTVWILVGGQSVRARPVHSGSLSCPEQGGGYEEGPTGSTACGEGASPLPACGGTCRSLLEPPTPPGDDNLPERAAQALAGCPRQRSRPFSREVDD